MINDLFFKLFVFFITNILVEHRFISKKFKALVTLKLFKE